MKIVFKPIDEISPYPNNPRHNAEAVDAVAASITEFGWQQPIVVDGDGVIIVGHTRWLAGKQLGEKKVPVKVETKLTPEQIKQYRIADNRLNEFAEWDLDKLVPELVEMQDLGSLALTGFSDDELADMLVPDEPEPGEPKSVTFSADQWTIVEAAISKVRVAADDDSMSQPRCIELVCADYLA